MARKIKNPEWQKVYYETEQDEYKRQMERAVMYGIKDEKGVKCETRAAINGAIAEKFSISESQVANWMRAKGTSGATYPESEELLSQVQEFLRKNSCAPNGETAMSAMIYQDFLLMLQYGMRKSIWERIDWNGEDVSEMRREIEEYGIYTKNLKLEFMSMSQRRSILMYLIEKSDDAGNYKKILDFYEGFSTSEECGIFLFNEYCDDKERFYEEVRHRIVMYRLDKEKIVKWLRRAENISHIRLCSTIGLNDLYWKCMDEYMEEFLRNIEGEGEITNFMTVLLRFFAMGYVPFAFNFALRDSDTDYDYLKRKYTGTSGEKGLIMYSDGRKVHTVDMEKYAYVYDWYKRENKNNRMDNSLTGYLRDEKKAKRKNLKRKVLELDNLEDILNIYWRDMKKEDFLESALFEEIMPDTSAVMRAACVYYDALRYMSDNKGSSQFASGFISAEDGLETYREFVSRDFSKEAVEEFAVEYLLTDIEIGFFNSMNIALDVNEIKEDRIIFTDALVAAFGKECFRDMVECFLYGRISTRDLEQQLDVTQSSYELRSKKIPALYDYLAEYCSDLRHVCRKPVEGKPDVIGIMMRLGMEA